MKQPDSMIFGSNGKGTSFSSRQKLVPAKIIDVDGLSTFHLSLRCGFSKKIINQNYDFQKLYQKKEANGSANGSALARYSYHDVHAFIFIWSPKTMQCRTSIENLSDSRVHECAMCSHSRVHEGASTSLRRILRRSRIRRLTFRP